MNSPGKTLAVQHIWIDNQIRSEVLISIDSTGRIAGIDLEPRPATWSAAESVRGLVIPGVPNVHSHAFQRGMAGLSEYRTSDRDDFWTWRQLMYHFLARLTPDDCYTIARQLYLEMLTFGYTTVGEFHYLHNDVDGSAYSESTEIGAAILAAAQEVGIRICLIPTLYQRGGFGDAPLEAGQRRFYLTLDQWLEQLRGYLNQTASAPLVSVAAALHSLRAVDIATAGHAVAGVHALKPDLPLHMHVAEQTGEVDACVRQYGRRPATLALDELDCDSRWCFIHATHLEPAERARLARRGVVAGLCPTTEANLGDGIFSSEEFLQESGRIAVGTDSHISIDPRSDLRMVEYAQRLSKRRRAVLALDNSSCGARLCQQVWTGGSQALALPLGEIALGYFADLIVLDTQHPLFCGLPEKHWLDAFIFSERGNPIQHTMVGGNWVVRDGHHPLATLSSATYHETIERILHR